QLYEYQILIDGEIHYEEARIVISGDNEATILIRDISDRKKAELSLRESEERYRVLAENINDLVCLHHPDGRYLYVSPSCEELLGYRYNEMLGQDPYTYFHPDDRDRIQQEAHTAAISGKSIPITYRMRQKSGNYIWFETLTNPIMDATGQVVQLQTTSRDVSDRIQVQKQLEHDTLHDALTGLPNRNLLMERLELCIHRAKRLDNYHFAVLFLDLDRFKVINDSLGHLAGDKLLMAISRKLQATLREIDLVARLGGDEFVILLDEIKDVQEAIHATQRIFADLKLPLTIEGREVYTTSSIGIVLGTKDYAQASHLLRDADIAMYRAKNSGKARYEIFDTQMHREALIRMHLENDLRQAIDCQEFVLHYQPIVSLDSGYLVGFEALMRWQHPSQGLKYPGEFIAVAEEIGLITSLSSWALRTACQQLAEWQTTFPDLSDLKVCVNLSVKDLRRLDLLAEIDLVLTQTQLDARCLTLEIPKAC
ncbi:MAG: diguanylate cyclase, partial [Pseudanabaena sp. ELA748]